VPGLRPRPVNCSFPGSGSSLHAARSYSWISPPGILRRRIRAAARSVTVAVVMSPASGGRRFPRPRRGPVCLRYRRRITGPAAPGPGSAPLSLCFRVHFRHYQQGSRIVSGIPVGPGRHRRPLPAQWSRPMRLGAGSVLARMRRHGPVAAVIVWYDDSHVRDISSLVRS
jgi:hypothetical protein